MKYARSSLATTVLAVFGLGVAVQNLHSHDRDVQARPIAVVARVTPVTWVDPPARGTPDTTGALVSAPPRPLTAAAIPPAPEAAPATMAAAEPGRRRTAIHRGKDEERSRFRIAHLRRSAHARTAAVEPAAIPRPTPQPARDASGRIDPIGDILRGLGFGRDG